MFDQRRRRWSDVVQMLYKYFVFAGKMRARRDKHLRQSIYLFIISFLYKNYYLNMFLEWCLNCPFLPSTKTSLVFDTRKLFLSMVTSECSATPAEEDY